MIQKNKRPIPKEFCIQKPVAASPIDIPKEEPKVIFTAESSYKKVQKKEPLKHHMPTSNSKNMIGPAVAAMLLMDVLK
ncbi:MAG: hypothetical protein AB7E42_08525 [Anaerotignaceae bacterium]